MERGVTALAKKQGVIMNNLPKIIWIPILYVVTVVATGATILGILFVLAKITEYLMRPY